MYQCRKGKQGKSEYNRPNTPIGLPYTIQYHTNTNGMVMQYHTIPIQYNTPYQEKNILHVIGLLQKCNITTPLTNPRTEGCNTHSIAMYFPSFISSSINHRLLE